MPAGSDEIAGWSATELAARIRHREVSSREVLGVLLDRIGRLDGPVNAVVTTDVERAFEEATKADEETAKGRDTGVLHGVPITIKDSWATAGMRTTSGAPELAEHVPDTDAAPVARLREAGAIVFGKTNLPLYAGDFQSYNEVFGTTSNPYDPTRTAGGSSGGSAAALACRFTPLELGSDIGGSIRIPAHACGVMGHKPSYGIVPAHGQIPGPPGTLSLADLAVAGPMARTVEDLELALGLLAGPNRWDEPGWKLHLPPPGKHHPSGTRVAVWLDDDRCPLEPEVRALLWKAAAALGGDGAVIDADVRPPFNLTRATEVFFPLLFAALSGGYPRDAVERFAADTSDGPVGVVHRATAMRHRDWLSANERRLQLRRQWEDVFSSWDVILLPVLPIPAFPHDHGEPMVARTIEVDGRATAYWDVAAWMAPAGAGALPATVVPVGLTSAGLPVGVQVVGPFLHDLTTLQVAGWLAERSGGCPTPPGFGTSGSSEALGDAPSARP